MGGFIKMGVLFVPSLAAAWAFVGCTDSAVIDLARNHYIYRSPGYAAPRRTDAPVYVTRLRDRRTVPNTDQGANYVQIYSDAVWDRPVPVMVEELLIDEIDRSGIYNGISSGTSGRPAATDFIVEPTLKLMYRMREAIGKDGGIGRRRAVAVSELKILVRSPADANNRRRTLLDESFHEIVATQPSLARPEEGIALSGKALERIMARILVRLYESNIPATSNPETTEAAAGKPADKRQADAQQPDKR